MPNIGAPELIIIAVIVLIVFGAGKLPNTLGDVGKGLRQFRENMEEADKAADELNRGSRG